MRNKYAPLRNKSYRGNHAPCLKESYCVQISTWDEYKYLHHYDKNLPNVIYKQVVSDDLGACVLNLQDISEKNPK